MNELQKSNIFIIGGVCGIIGTIFYVLAGFLSLNQIILYVLAMAWPILSIIFVYSIYKYVALEHQTTANQLSFIFATLGFTVVTCMISVQLAVRWGIDDFVQNSPENEELLILIRQSARLIDHGLDVAWDLLIGTSLIFLFAAIKGHYQFRLFWAIPPLILGLALIVLNVLTFPWPPNSVGSVDVGPLIGLYIIAISIRLCWLGVLHKKDKSREVLE